MERNRFGSLGSSTQVKGKALKRASGVMLAVLAAGLLAVTGAQAALTYSGDLSPADPNTWTSSTTAYVGNTANGTLSVSGDSDLQSNNAYLGYNTTSNGTATITGVGSTWSLIALGVGYLGSGTFNITDGGVVSSGGGINLAGGAGGSGTLNISGTGSILTHSGPLEAGLNGNGVISITNGGRLVSNNMSRIGYMGGGKGSVTVDGADSSWSINGGTFYIGGMGSGTLTITNGGKVSSAVSRIGANSGGKGTVTIDGSGSNWNASTLVIGYNSNGTGRVSISDGGAVTASSVSINSLSALTTDVGKGSSLRVGGGSGTITNNGKIRLVAGAAAANGTYTPMSYGTMSGTGSVQALGGIWDATNHTVTVTSAATGAAGSALTVDLATTQRFLFTDGASGKQVGAAFQAATSPTNLTMTASSISGSVLASLQGLLGAGQAVLSGWDFNATEGYTAGSPVYLSLFAGTGHSLYDLNIWHYDGSAWSKFDASDLAYDKTFASFTATDLSGYAVTGTAPVPIPAAAWLLGSGLMGLVGARRRFFRA